MKTRVTAGSNNESGPEDPALVFPLKRVFTPMLHISVAAGLKSGQSDRKRNFDIIVSDQGLTKK